MKKIIVFGASGETGRYFIDYCVSKRLDKTYQIIAVGGRKTDFFEKYFGIVYVSMDIVDKKEFTKLPADDIYAVVDLAGYMPARMDGEATEKMFQINLMGTLNILEYCIKVHADRILFAQSFGDIKDHAENDPLLAVDLPRKFSFNTDHTTYLIAKNAAVDLIEYYHQHYGLKKFIFRLPTVYLYAKDRFFYRDGVKTTLWYRVLIDRACAGEDLEVWGNPSRVKDMVYVKDFAQMLYLALFVNRDDGFYNVGTGIGTSLYDQLNIMRELLSPPEKKSELVLKPDKPDTPQYIMDITPAKKELGYEPIYNYQKYLLDYYDEMCKKRFDTI